MYLSRGSLDDSTTPQPCVYYVVSRYPKKTETFVRNEVEALRQSGVNVRVAALFSRDLSVSPSRFTRGNEYYPFVSPHIVMARFLYWFIRRPLSVCSWIIFICGSCWSKPRTLAKNLLCVPLATSIASDARSGGFRHIHAHWATYPALSAMIASSLIDIEYSFTAHAHDLFVSTTLLRRKVARAKFVVTISTFNSRILERFQCLGRPDVHIVRCGVDDEWFEVQPQIAATEPFKVVAVGALEEKKGHGYLLEACRSLKDRGQEFRCEIVGDGELRPDLLESIDQMCLSQEVTLLGWKTPDELRRILAGAGVFVMPSVIARDGAMEGIPVALMEAMACCLPVVASDISAIGELVEDGRSGVLVGAGDSAAIADAIQELAQDSAKAKSLARAGREAVRRDYRLSKNVERLRTLLVGSSCENN